MDDSSFQFRRLIVYQRACQYDELVQTLIPLIQKRDRNLGDHLKRSTNSLLTNLSEAASEDRPLMKAASFRIAKRETEECALSLDTSLRRKYTPRNTTELALAYLDECARMLASLICKFDPPDNNPE